MKHWLKMCSGSLTQPHDEVVFMADFCPVCKLRKKIKALSDELDSLQDVRRHDEDNKDVSHD
jgi:hypothetical protein